MPCTTILVGKKASYDGSTLIARNDDGPFEPKKLIIVTPAKQPKKYQSKIGHLKIELPENPLRYSSTPTVQGEHGVWPANGINEANVAMTATETITSNPRVLGADPYVRYVKAKKRKEKDVIGGIGEEDLVLLVLPYIKTAREGVLRLGSLLEKYGTYEANGIAFSDENEIWWLETIGGHHWIARRVKDDEYVIMPNQFGMDRFDLTDAFGAQKENLCSSDLKAFIQDHHLDVSLHGVFNPRHAFGSHSDQDHVYNTPRAWFIGRYFNPRTFKWDGPDAKFTPESDDIPWSLKPEKNITIEEVKYILSSYYQGTPYNPYQKADVPTKGIYRPIAVANTNVMEVLQIRGYMPKELKAIEWLCFGSNAFNACIPLYFSVSQFPKYVSQTPKGVSSEYFYWASRLIGPLVDAHFGSAIQMVERYQELLPSKGYAILNEYDKKVLDSKDPKILEEANEKICKMAKEESENVLGKVLRNAGEHSKNRYSRSDN